MKTTKDKIRIAFEEWNSTFDSEFRDMKVNDFDSIYFHIFKKGYLASVSDVEQLQKELESYATTLKLGNTSIECISVGKIREVFNNFKGK